MEGSHAGLPLRVFLILCRSRQQHFLDLMVHIVQ